MGRLYIPVLTGITVEEAADDTSLSALRTVTRMTKSEDGWLRCYFSRRLLLDAATTPGRVATDALPTEGVLMGTINRALAEYMACKKIRQFKPWIISECCCGLCFYQEYEFDSMKDPYQRPGFMSTAVTNSQGFTLRRNSRTGVETWRLH
jgi:hypothetical protein